MALALTTQAPTRVACSARPQHTTRASTGRVAAAAKPSRAARLSLQRNTFSELASGAAARRSSGVCHAAGDDGSETPDGNVSMITSADEWRDALSNAGDKLIVLDISTKTCGPCKMIYPHFVKMSQEDGNKDIVFLKIFGEVSQETRDLMKEWGVRSVPQFHFWKNGERVDQMTGSKPDALKAKIAEVAAVAA